MMLASCPEARNPGPRGGRTGSDQQGEGSESGTDSRRHVVELPADLLFDRFGTVRLRKADGLDGIGSGTQCMRTHVADGDRLTRGAGRSRRGRRPHLTRPHATCEPLANALGRVQLSPGVCARPGNQRPRSIITWSVGLEQM